MNDFVMVRIPRNLYDALVTRAAAEDRSATAQAVAILKRDLKPEIDTLAGKRSDKAA